MNDDISNNDVKSNEINADDKCNSIIEQITKIKEQLPDKIFCTQKSMYKIS